MSSNENSDSDSETEANRNGTRQETPLDDNVTVRYNIDNTIEGTNIQRFVNTSPYTTPEQQTLKDRQEETRLHGQDRQENMEQRDVLLKMEAQNLWEGERLVQLAGRKKADRDKLQEETRQLQREQEGTTQDIKSDSGTDTETNRRLQAVLQERDERELNNTEDPEPQQHTEQQQNQQSPNVSSVVTPPVQVTSSTIKESWDAMTATITKALLDLSSNVSNIQNDMGTSKMEDAAFRQHMLDMTDQTKSQMQVMREQAREEALQRVQMDIQKQKDDHQAHLDQAEYRKEQAEQSRHFSLELQNIRT
jgi:hypothetical protein